MMLLVGVVNSNKGTINFSHGFSTKYFTESDNFNCSTTFSAEYAIQSRMYICHTRNAITGRAACWESSDEMMNQIEEILHH